MHSGTFKTQESRAGLVRVPLFWKSFIAYRLILYHVYMNITFLFPINKSKTKLRINANEDQDISYCGGSETTQTIFLRFFLKFSYEE